MISDKDLNEMIKSTDELQGWENVSSALKELLAYRKAFEKPEAWLTWHSIPPTYHEPDRGGEYLAVHESAGEKNDDGSDAWPVYRKPEIT